MVHLVYFLIYKLINEIKLQTFNSTNKRNKSINLMDKSSKKYKEKINQISNKEIRDSLYQLLEMAKK